ncbi:MAG: hypothetical protein Q7J07_10000 [Pelolinea sp.]|nr:hypothetical protein [Pelolinea sp.]
MKKNFIVVVMITAAFLSGCSLVDQFEQAKDEYLETRVVELLEELPEEEPVVAEPVVEEALAETEEVLVEESEPVEEESANEEKSAEEVEVTEEVEEAEEPTDADMAPEETEEPEEAIVESDDPGIYLGDAAWSDDMETAEYWPTGTDQYSSAAYENGKLKITALSEINGWRIASTPVLGNAYIEADVKMGACAETDGFGFIFRVPENTGYNRGYLFGVTCDGRYSIRKWDGLSGENGTMVWLQYYKVSEWINKGKDQTNRIGVMTLDGRLLLFVNGEKVDEVSDETYAEGFFGLYINRDRTENLNILVDKVSYWTDPQEK